MYKILIVDDEQGVRQAIVQTLCWQSEGYELIGEAKNGKEALEICENTLPDVIITDINMPYVNGLELLEAVKRYSPEPKVILLTAYDDFNYAQKAIKNNAYDYILKPITKEEMLKVLRKLKENLDKEILNHEDFEKLKEEFKNHLPILQEKFLTSLLSTQTDDAEILNKSRLYKINISPKEHIVAIISVEDQKDFSDELRRFAVCNIAQEIMQKEKLGITFITPAYVVLLAMGENINKSIKIFEKIQKYLNKYLNFSVTIGVGYKVDGPGRICLSYKSAVTACNYKILNGTNKILCIDDLEPLNTDNSYFYEFEEFKFAMLIKTKDIEALNNQINNIFLNLLTYYKENFEIYIVEIAVAIFKTAKESGLDTTQLYSQNADIFACIINMEDVLQIRERLKNMCKQIVEGISDLRKNSALQLIDEAKQYVYENYTNPDITTDKICTHLHVSVSHFCATFKKETGDTIINFLNVYRMDKAKEYLATTNLKITEIAYKVGYTDPNYFSFAFKKMFNVSPREFKKQ